MVLVVLTDPNTYSAIKRLMSRTAFLLIPLSILLIKYYPDFGRSYNPWDGVSNYGGVTTFKNLLGMTCLICGLGCLWIFTDVLREKKGMQRAKRSHRVRHNSRHGCLALLDGELGYLPLLLHYGRRFDHRSPP